MCDKDYFSLYNNIYIYIIRVHIQTDLSNLQMNGIKHKTKYFKL